MTREPCPVGPFPDTGPEYANRSAADETEGVAPWCDMLREHFVALDVDDVDRDGPFPSRVRSTLVGHLSAAVVSSAPQSAHRTPGLARHDPHTYLQVGMVAEGTAVLEQDGRQAVLGRGAYAVYETDRPFTWHFDGPWKLLVLTWPRELVALGGDVTRAATARTLGGDRLGAIVGHALADTALSPPALSDAGGGRLAGQLAALLGTAVGESLRRGDVLSPSSAADLRRRVDAYVAEHLEDPALGPEDIARAHFISVRALHRVFADAEETVGALVRRRRLEHARRRLLDPRDAGLSLTEIACACGFADLASFSRAFKLRYHEPPGSYRRRAGLRDDRRPPAGA
ncbi:helix-turn-helix domain-containing protein [Actinomycetospora sp. TBRC 11914]|uniref:helix-turn-helix domain-containing protein n=1 Tax=Actinomycetospora sp. TBRC 11914 TaxID=2729387 RepID=UPI00145D2D24|nr:helix-turn-helix domain-containing protein [Actinomycetospora sp. TBRC 11914]NMO88942.1 helix-turn-helix domain-containing protein [Actinomycetospora sp. TBRC 11914]